MSKASDLLSKFVTDYSKTDFDEDDLKIFNNLSETKKSQLMAILIGKGIVSKNPNGSFTTNTKKGLRDLLKDTEKKRS